MRRVIYSLLLLGCLVPPALATEYFAGPFASWINVKAAPYNATGNGSNDDTAAIQKALNAVSVSHSVVYLPAGTYRISAPLTVLNQYGFSFIGASPAATTILWAGSSNGTMMRVLATGSSSWGRITWEGSNSAAIGVAHSCTEGSCGEAGSQSSTDDHHFDEVFQDIGKGIAGGVSQVAENSEMTVSRCTFRDCSYAGLSVESYNALNYWVWDCTFLNCARGLTNEVSGGNFSAYRCLFEGSTIADIQFSNVQFFSFRDNVSIGSNQFINGLGSNSPVELSVQGNRVVDTANPTAIYLNNLGPTLLVDNQIQSQPGASGPVVELLAPNGTDVGGPDLVSIGNQYTVSNPITVITGILALGQSARWWSQEDQVVSNGSISSAVPAMPPLPAQLTANITDLPAGSSAASIQAAINAAAALNPAPAAPPVIHLPAGSYSLNQTLTVPANLNVLITGDGARTNLSNSFTGTLLQLNSPSRATLMNLALAANGGDGVLVLDSDQPGSRVFGEGLYMSGNETNDVLADTLANTQVILQGFEDLRGGQVGVKSIGTRSAAVSSLVGIYGASTSTVGGAAPTNGWMYEVSNQGRMLVQDAWYESGSSPTVVNLGGADSGVFSFWGGNLGGGTKGSPVIVDGFNGLAAFMNLNYGIQAGSQISVTPAGQTQAWFLGQVANQPNYFTETGNAGTVFFNNGQGETIVGGSTEPLQIADKPSNSLTPPNPPDFPVSFVDNMLSLARSEQLPPLADLPPGVTDARLYRLFFNNCGIGLDVTSSDQAPTPVPTAPTTPASPTATATITPTPTATLTPTITSTPTITPTFTSTPFAFVSLDPGDIAFTGYAANGTSQFSFVALKDIHPGTGILFTDRGWDDTLGGLTPGQEVIAFTAGEDLSPGTQVVITGTTATLADGITGAGTVTGPGLNLHGNRMTVNKVTASGDQILAYQGSSGAPAFIAALNMYPGGWLKFESGAIGSDFTSYLPPDLANGVNALALLPSAALQPDKNYLRDAVYKCADRDGTPAGIRAAVMTRANWTLSSAGPATFMLPNPSSPGGIGAPLCSFGPVSPTPTFTPTGTWNSPTITPTWTETPAEVYVRLQAGDVAFTGYSAGATGGSGFSFMLLRSIRAGTQVFFTNDAWNSSSDTWGNNGNQIMWTSNVTYLAGTQILIQGLRASVINTQSTPTPKPTSTPRAGTPTATPAGTVTPLFAGDVMDVNGGTGIILSRSGDQVTAFQGTLSKPLILGAINMEPSGYAPAANSVPQGLTVGLNTLALMPPESDFNAYFSNCPALQGASGQKGSLILPVLMTQTNWTTDANGGETIPPVPGCGVTGVLPAATNTRTAVPTKTPTPARTNTPTITPTGVFVPTNTPTPPGGNPNPGGSNAGLLVEGAGGHGDPAKIILAPVPVRSGEPLCLYNSGDIVSAGWQVYNVMGERIADESFSGSGNPCWDSTQTAPGIYIVEIKLNYPDGTMAVVRRKIIIQ